MGQTQCNFPIDSFLKVALGTDECTTDPARFYMQYFCEQNLDAVNTKRHAGLIVACISIFTCLLFLVTASLLNQNATLDYKIWDMHTVTAGDFTVSMPISEAMWTVYNDIHTFDQELDRTTNNG